jgi:hypothetical protein
MKGGFMQRGKDNEEEANVLSVEEVEKRAWQAADRLVEIIANFNQGRFEEPNALRAYFASQCVSLLIQRFNIPAPAMVTQNEGE